MCQKCIKYVTSSDIHPILGVKKLISLSEYISTTIGPFEARLMLQETLECGEKDRREAGKGRERKEEREIESYDKSFKGK